MYKSAKVYENPFKTLEMFFTSFIFFSPKSVLLCQSLYHVVGFKQKKLPSLLSSVQKCGFATWALSSSTFLLTK